MLFLAQCPGSRSSCALPPGKLPSCGPFLGNACGNGTSDNVLSTLATAAWWRLSGLYFLWSGGGCARFLGQLCLEEGALGSCRRQRLPCPAAYKYGIFPSGKTAQLGAGQVLKYWTWSGVRSQDSSNQAGVGAGWICLSSLSGAETRRDPLAASPLPGCWCLAWFTHP